MLNSTFFPLLKLHFQLKLVTDKKTRDLFRDENLAGVKLWKEGKSIRAIEHNGQSHFSSL